MPKLSIITINYNDANGLEKTIHSVAKQTFPDKEFIVVDGGSSDGSKEVIDKNLAHIDFWVSEKDSGIYNAMNKGIKMASGEYCLFLNSGDYLAEADVLEKIFSGQHTEDIVYGDMMIDWGPNTTLGKMPDTITFEHMYADTIWHPVSFIKRKLFDTVGMYDESYRMVADYDFFFKAAIIHNVSLVHVPVAVSVYNTAGLSSQPDKKIQEREERKRVLTTNLPEKMLTYLEKQQIEKKSETTILKSIWSKLKS